MPEFDEPKSISDEDGMVNKLRQAGAVFIGITNMHQLGIGLTGINPSKYVRSIVFRSACPALKGFVAKHCVYLCWMISLLTNFSGVSLTTRFS